MVKQKNLCPPILLTEGTTRLLHWLERYPFQRMQDLVLALAPWQKRTTVYERLAELKRFHFIEGLHAGVAPKKQLYHLSPLGTVVCDHLAFQSDPGNQEKRAHWERWGQQGSGPIVREEREKLVRLLPRLSIFLLLQDVINSLVTNASSALTRQGHHASIVQWSWLRDYERTFASPHEQPLRVRVDGALTLCLRFMPGEASATSFARSWSLEEHWYTLFLLHCPLDDARLMRARLDRLLRWRESAERTAVYSQMPPLLILATTERQAERWHEAATQVASRLHLNQFVGAVTCLPRAQEALANVWHLPWKRIGSKEFCHLQELVRSWPTPTLPELLAWRGEANAQAHPRSTQQKDELNQILPLRLRLSSYTLATPAGKTRSARTQKASDYRLSSVSLTPRHWEIVRLCFAHPLLSREDFAQLLVLSRTTINLLLADLVHASYLGSVDTPVGERWQVAETGLRLLARLACCHVHRLVRFPREEQMPLIQRGVPGLLHQARHTAGVYAFFSQLSAALATLPNAHVRWWETGVLSERHFRFREQTYRFRPDALATVQLGERRFRFWLEWDRGTMTLKNLRLKFATYAMYLASREWATSSPYLPALLCVTPDIEQEVKLTRAALQRLVHVPAGLCVYTTTAQLLMTQGILSPIWRNVELSNQQPSRASSEVAPRIGLFAENKES